MEGFLVDEEGGINFFTHMYIPFDFVLMVDSCLEGSSEALVGPNF